MRSRRRAAIWAAAAVAVLMLIVGGVAVLGPGRRPWSRMAGGATTTGGGTTDSAGQGQPSGSGVGGGVRSASSRIPVGTVALLPPDFARPGTRLEITFRLVGRGDLGTGSETVVVKVVSSRVVAGAARASVAGRNIVLQTHAGKNVIGGGLTHGTVVFRRQGGMLLPVLTAIKVAKGH